MKGSRSLVAAALASLLAAHAATAAEIRLHEDTGARERTIVSSLYGDFIKAHPGMQVETALVDLQGKGVASIAARFVSPDTCGGEECETVLLAHRDGAWRAVFQHAVRTIETAPSAGLPGSEGMASLVVDGKVRWIWSGFDHYMPDLASLGRSFPAPVPAAPNVATAARAAMGGMLDGASGVEFRQVPLSLESVAGAALPGYLVSAYAPGLCSNVVGCPHALLLSRPGGLKPVWTGMAMGPGAVMPSASDGLRDIALGDRRGYVVLRFDGTQYRDVETSYPSPTTPAP